MSHARTKSRGVGPKDHARKMDWAQWTMGAKDQVPSAWGKDQGPRAKDQRPRVTRTGSQLRIMLGSKCERKNELCRQETDHADNRGILYPRIEFILLAIYFSIRHQALITAIYMSSRSEEKKTSIQRKRADVLRNLRINWFYNDATP